MNKYEYINLLGYKVFTDSLEKLNFSVKNRREIINTINPHSYITAKKDSEFKEALKSSGILLPDGSGIVLAARFLKGEKISKIAGYGFTLFLLNELNSNSGRCFFLGSSEDTLEKIKARINKEYPKIEAEAYSPPYKEEFDYEDNLEILARINTFKPDVLFVGMTAPKQEKWVYRNIKELSECVVCSVGAVFDFFAGTKKRSSKFWIRLHLEWLPRLIREPKRMWKRNFISTPLFLIDLVLWKIRIYR